MRWRKKEINTRRTRRSCGFCLSRTVQGSQAERKQEEERKEEEETASIEDVTEVCTERTCEAINNEEQTQ